MANRTDNMRASHEENFRSSNALVMSFASSVKILAAILLVHLLKDSMTY